METALQKEQDLGRCKNKKGESRQKLKLSKARLLHLFPCSDKDPMAQKESRM